MCLVWDVVVILLAINITPTLPALVMTGSLIEIFIPLTSWIMNMTSFTVSDKATHSVSELDNVMLLCAFDHQDTGIPKM